MFPISIEDRNTEFQKYLSQYQDQKKSSLCLHLFSFLYTSGIFQSFRSHYGTHHFSHTIFQNNVLLEETWTSSFVATYRTLYIHKKHGFHQGNKLIQITTTDSFSCACISCICIGSNSIPSSYLLCVKARAQSHESFPVGAIQMQSLGYSSLFIITL